MIQELQRPVILFFLLLLSVILYLLYKLFPPFLHTLLLSRILAGLFFPAFRNVERFLRGRRIAAAPRPPFFQGRFESTHAIRRLFPSAAT